MVWISIGMSIVVWNGFEGDSFREYPVSGGLPGNVQRPEDKQNYVLLLKELREQLDRVSRDQPYLLTVA